MEGHKSKELKSIIEACAGLYLEVSADTPNISKGNDIELTIEALNRSKVSMDLESYTISTQSDALEKKVILESNVRQNFKDTISIPHTLKRTSPYWLERKGSLGMYKVEDRKLIGLPETPRSVTVDFNLNIDNVPITLTKDVIYRYSKPDEGELYRPFEIIPEASASINNKVIIFENDQQKDISVVVKAGKIIWKGMLV